MTAIYPATKARLPRPRRPWCLPSLRRFCSCTSPWTIRLTSKSMASRTIIGSSVMLWVLTRLGIRGRQRGKIHCRGPHPLERGVGGKMASSIDFVRPADSALSELRTLGEGVGVAFTREEEVNKGAGLKLHGTVDNQPVAILLYYNRNKGISSKIIFEKMPEDRKASLMKCLSSTKSPSAKAIPIYASIIVADKNARRAIRESLIAANLTLTDCPKQNHMDYLVKILSAGNELTITQFSSGTLLLQD